MIRSMVLTLIAASIGLAQSLPSDEELHKLFHDGKYKEFEALVRQKLAAEEARDPESLEVAQQLDFLMKAGALALSPLDAEMKAVAERAIALRRKVNGPQSREYASTLLIACDLMWSRRMPKESIPLAREAVAIYEARNTGGASSGDLAAALQSLGSAQVENDDLTAAKTAFERACHLYEQAGTAGTRDHADCLQNLAGVYRRLGEYPAARIYYTKALEMDEKLLGPDHPGFGVVLMNLANLLTNMHEPAEAAPLYGRSARIMERAFGPDSARTGVVLANLANSLANSGHFAESLPTFARSREIYVKQFGTDSIAYAGFLYTYGSALASNGRTQDAITAGIEAETVNRNYYAALMRGSPERDALLHAAAMASGVRPNALNLLFSLAAAQADPRPALDQWIRSRAAVFDEMAARQRTADTAGDADVAAAAAELRKKRENLAAVVVRGQGSTPAAQYAAELARAREQTEQAERNLAARSERFRRDLQGHHAGLAEISAALPPGSALVSYARYVYREYKVGESVPYPRQQFQKAYIAFVLRAGGAPVAVPLGEASNIEELTKAVREKISAEAQDPGRAPQRSEQLYRDAAARLRQKIWDPIAPLVAGAGRVFIVPDGDLNIVNFAALPTGATAYLIENGPLLHYLSTERDLLAPSAAPGSKGLLAVGNPAFDKTPASTVATLRGANCSAFQNLHFDRLPDSAREVADLAALFRQYSAGDAVALTGAAASKDAFRQQAGHKQVVHVATHGFFLGSNCRPAGQDAANPLLLSGLVFAGANERAAAGILTAEEIAGMNLDGVQWAVLSACDTALGEFLPGEGVFGLRRAFQQAGARTVIMSVWPADDQVTRAWMRTLYQGRFASHLDTAQAVQAASLGLLKARRKAGESTHPLYWGGFIAAGAWK